MVIIMDDKKLNRILRFIETEGGLDTTEYEYILATLNRMYIKRILMMESRKDILGKQIFPKSNLKAVSSPLK